MWTSACRRSSSRRCGPDSRCGSPSMHSPAKASPARSMRSIRWSIPRAATSRPRRRCRTPRARSCRACSCASRCSPVRSSTTSRCRRPRSPTTPTDRRCSWCRRTRRAQAPRNRPSSPRARPAATRSRCSVVSRRATRWSPAGSSSSRTARRSTSAHWRSLRTRPTPPRRSIERSAAMKFTDLFIERPVLSVVVSLLILVLGARAVFQLPVSQYPKTENAVVTVSTTYYGADAQTIAGFITQPLEAAISQAQGIDYLSSNSIAGVSIITATLRLNYDANRAMTEINTQVASVRNQLPPASQQPVITVQVGQQIDAMYLGYFSDTIPPNSTTDYLLRVVKPKLDSIDGVQTAEILGGRTFALRAWLDPQRMAARGVAADDVYAALGSNNYLAGVGSTKGQMVSVDLKTNTDLQSLDEFRELVIKRQNGALVRLQDVANVVLGAESYDFNVAFSGQRSVFIGIKVAPKANILDVAARVRAALPDIAAQLPTGVTQKLAYDATIFVTSSIKEVIKTLAQALIIVTVVIFLFLGSPRAVVIPVVAMPLSLIGAFFLMQAFDYSINLLTLLALVLAIGLVVDDAIIVVENVDRHLKQGVSPLEAALQAARELGGPIIAMTVVLVAAYVPIGLQGGLTGALFTQFAFTLAGAVTVSAVIALTLSPMMCSKVFRLEQEEGRFTHFLDRTFNRVRSAYSRTLASWLTTWQVVLVFGVLILAGVVYLFMTSKSELAPQEDQGIVLEATTGPPDATLYQMQAYSDAEFEIAKKLPEYRQMFQLTGQPTVNQGFGGVVFAPWDQRHRSAAQLQMLLQNEWNKIPGARV